jgi:uncharacterized membrane protein (DUF4010 family)
MGDRARASPEVASAAASAGVASNVVTFVQLAVVIGTLSPPLLARVALPLAAGGSVAIAVAFLIGIRSNATSADAGKLGGKRPFEPLSALRFMAIFAGIILVAAIVRTHLGNVSIPWVLGISGIADVHAAAASAAQLVSSGEVDIQSAALGVLTALAANTALKCALALARGGGGYALRVIPGVLAATATFALVLFIGKMQ